MVDAMRASTQSALQARISRQLVEMPEGFEYGVEGTEQQRKQRAKRRTAPGEEDVARSDRELARLYVEVRPSTPASVRTCQSR